MMVKEFLKGKQLTKRALTDIKFSGGDIQVNGQKETVRRRLAEGDRVAVMFPEEKPSEGLIPQEIPLSIVYEDDHCIVLNKRAGMPTIPSRLHPDQTVANGLLYHLQKQQLSSTIHIVNRLDKDTSGLMLAAKHRYSHSLFSMQQKEIGIHRAYTAIVHGRVESDEGMINKPIGRKPGSIIEREVREDGQHAVTAYKTLGRKESFSLLSLKLETGRTHQIRVHMSSIGHPLAGDTLYGGLDDRMKRQALHSTELTFWHPFLQKELKFETGLPDDMKEFWLAEK
ncbi:RluA family pseudouridine synthase [Bacillus sp. FJAT-42376]|uniref:RluA family pseudouridine synthase n=1 Tax=Bacillus sp. FJAT-42376 TaxID=2014076 RepID=UPI000F4EC189|nr:RluA family pseudouridine synthase [Bacillus sp. FJAT-42376]AZB44794.1 RluA family pseudouridine synthase [Bacillus sp. FJAT-42376]